MPLSREEDFLRNTSFLYFLPQNYLPFGLGSWNLQFLVFLPYRWYILNLVKIGPVVLEKKMLTDCRNCNEYTCIINKRNVNTFDKKKKNSKNYWNGHLFGLWAIEHKCNFWKDIFSELLRGRMLNQRQKGRQRRHYRVTWRTLLVQAG